MKFLNKKILFGMTSILFFSFMYTTVDATPTQVQLSHTEGLSYNPQLAVNENNVYAVWTDDSPGNKEIFFSKSTDGGLTFEKSINLSNNNGTSAFPRMDVFDGKIFVTWYDYSLGKSEIFLARSLDDGITFETSIVSNNAGASYNPWIRTDGKNVYVVWNDETPHMAKINVEGPENVDIVLGDLEILIATSNDEGETFDVFNLSNSKDSVSWDPRIFLLGEKVYVVWNETTRNGDEIFFSMSSDSGDTFSTPINISVSNAPSTAAGIQVLEDNIYIIWVEAGNIFFSTSDDGGISFSQPVRISLSGGTSEMTRDTQMIVSNSDVFVVWYDKVKNKGVFLSKSNDYGKTFGEPVIIADFSYSLDAQIASNGDSINIISNQISDDSHIFLRSSNDGGKNFASLEKLSEGHDDSSLSVLGPQIVTTDNKIYIVFESKRQDASDLYLKIIDIENTLDNGYLLLKTPEEAIEIKVNFGEDLPDIEKQTTFQLQFIDPETDSLIENVHYSFEITNSSGYIVQSNQNQLADDGIDIQNVKFLKSGSVTIKIDVIGTGNNEPYETKFSGSTSAVITVVPEFPISAIGILILISSMALVLGKLPLKQLKIR
jgi:hypothetical protein